MQIAIIADNRYIKPGKYIESKFVLRPREIAPERKYFRLQDGKNDLSNIEGTDVQVTGFEYVIGRRHYPLEEYSILARLTPNNELIPHLREATGKEVSIIKDKNGTGINNFWPVIRKVEE